MGGTNYKVAVGEVVFGENGDFQSITIKQVKSGRSDDDCDKTMD